MPTEDPQPVRKIIHVDMDCFYAAIEERERPELRGVPLAVGGASDRRGVLTTCNYAAREFGCRSAMPTFQALQRCPDLVVVPPRFDLYKAESRRVRDIFRQFTDLIEPLSLDEAYLDVTARSEPASRIAREIRRQIQQTTGLTASAGIAPNKMIAKIASDWRKPNGQFVVRPEKIEGFVRTLPVRKIWGVGPKAAEKLAGLGVQTCADLQAFGLPELQRLFGKFGVQLFELCRGIDPREVKPNRERKSLSNENTFPHNLPTLAACQAELPKLVSELREDYEQRCAERQVKSVFVKLKFADFKITTAERAAPVELPAFENLLEDAWNRRQRPVRLIGVGIRFAPCQDNTARQLELF